MKKVFNSCLGAVLLSNLFTMRLQKGSVDCISFIEVSLGLFLLLLLVVSLLIIVFEVSPLSKIISMWWWFFGFLDGRCFSNSTSGGNCFDHVYQCIGFVPLGFFWCFSGSSTSCERQSAALFLAPEIHSNVML